MKKMVKRVLKRVFPPETAGFHILQSLGRKLHILPRPGKGDVAYAEWIKNGEPQIWNHQDDFTYKPLISILVPVFNAPDYYLLPMVYSVVAQKYTNWELVLVNGSTEAAHRQLTEDCAQIDSRIKVAHLETNQGIAGNTNAGIKHCSGEYIALLDHDDLLSPFALHEVVHVLQGSAARRPEFIYSDEDKLSDDGEYRFDPHFKPDWSPQILKSAHYLNHLTVLSAGVVKKAGGIRTGLDGAQDYDFYLRILDEKPRITHIPKILYHWRAARNSTAQNFTIKKGVTDSGERVLTEHLKRNKQHAKVRALPKRPGFYRIDYDLPKHTKATVVVFPTKNKDQQQALIEQAVTSAAASEAKVEIIVPVAANHSLQGDYTLRIIEAADNRAFLKQALKVATGDFIIGMNAGIIPKDKDWIDRLGGLVCQSDTVGVAGPQLLDKGTNTLLDAGYVLQEGRLIPLFEGTPPATHTYFGSNDWARNVQALSGRVWAARTDVARKYNAVGFPLSYQRMLDDGLEVVFWPFVRLYFVGDLQVPATNTAYFTGHLQYVQGQLKLPRAVELPVRRSE